MEAEEMVAELPDPPADKITARNVEYALLPSTYWHLTDENDFLLHNVFLGEGISMSVSAVRKIPGLQKATSPYAFFKADTDAKEAVWETVRLEKFNHLPSSSASFYLFDSEDTAIATNAKWFNGQRLIVQVRIVRGAQTHTADACLLDCENKRPEWGDYATRYWSGEMTQTPLAEVLVDGSLYFPDWKSKPFGLWKPK